jgi:hypothetical protein
MLEISEAAWSVSSDGHFLLSILFPADSLYLSAPPRFILSLGLYSDLGLSGFDCACSLFPLNFPLVVDTFSFELLFPSACEENPFSIKMSLFGNMFVPCLTPFSKVMTDLIGEFCCCTYILVFGPPLMVAVVVVVFAE